MNHFFRAEIVSLSIALFASVALADEGLSDRFASVTELQGRVTVAAIDGSGKHPLDLREQVPLGSVIDCASRSFVRLSMPDGSSLSVAPETRLAVQAARSDAASVWDLATGRIRAQINGEHKDKEKLVIRAHAVAMGIRGTDFVVSTTSQGAVTLVTVQGSVTMAVVPSGGSAMEALHGAQAVNVSTGQLSAAKPGSSAPSAPSEVPPTMLKQLQSNGASVPAFNGNGSINSSKQPENLGSARQGNGAAGTAAGGPGAAAGGATATQQAGQRGNTFQGAGGAPSAASSAGSPQAPGGAGLPPPGSAGAPGGQILPPSGANLNPGAPSPAPGGPGGPTGPQAPGRPPPGKGGQQPPPPPQPPPQQGSH